MVKMWACISTEEYIDQDIDNFISASRIIWSFNLLFYLFILSQNLKSINTIFVKLENNF